MACKYSAPNKVSSELYDNLYRKYGPKVARATYLYTRSSSFKTNYGAQVQYDANGDVLLSSLESLNLVITASRGDTVLPANLLQEEAAQIAKRTIKVKSLLGEKINLVEDDSATASLTITQNATGNNVVTINPGLLFNESPYHELGHVIPSIGRALHINLVNNPLKLLRGGPLEQAIAYLNPGLTQIELENEVLNTALGEKPEVLFPDDVDKQEEWTRYTNILLRKVGEFLKQDIADVKKTIPEMVSTRLMKNLINHHSIQDIVDRDLRLVRDNFLTVDKFLEKAALNLQLKMETYFAGMSAAQKAQNVKYADLQYMRDTLLQWAQVDANKGIVEFISYAIYQTGLLEQRVARHLYPVQQGIASPDTLTAKEIKDIINYNNMFGELLDDILTLAEKNPTLQSILDNTTSVSINVGSTPVIMPVTEGVLKHIGTIRGRYLKVVDSSKEVALLYVAHKAITSGIRNGFEQHLRDKLARKWSNDPANLALLTNKETALEAKKERAAYVEKEIEAAKVSMTSGGGLFYEAAKEYYLNILQQSGDDISWFERWLLTGNQINDEAIQLGQEMLDKADYAVRKDTQAKYREAVAIFEDFNKLRPQSNQFEKYDEMIELDVDYDFATQAVTLTERRTDHMTGRYYSKFWEIKSALGKAVGDAQELFGTNSAEFNRAKNEYRKFLKGNTRQIVFNGEKIRIPNKKWENPQYDLLQSYTGTANEPILKAYNYLLDNIRDDDLILPEGRKLFTTSANGHPIVKLPAILREGLVEVVGDKGFAGYGKHIWHRIKNVTKVEDSTEFGGDIIRDANKLMLAEADEQGRERHRVPVNFRQNLEPEDRSYDLFSLMLMNHAMSKNYEEKSAIQHEMALVQDILASREVNVKPSWIKTKVNRLLNGTKFKPTPITKKGVDSNAYKAFTNLMRTRLYGIKRQGSITINKISDVLISYTGSLYLGLNFYSAGANLLSGQLQNRIEAMGKGLISNSAINKAMKAFTLNPKELTSVAADLGRPIPKSRTNLLMEALNPKSDWEPLFNTFNANNAFKRTFNNTDSSLGTAIGEHLIQGTMMYAVLFETKALSVNGLYLDSDFNETTDIKKAINMEQAYSEREADGRVKLHPNVKGLETKNFRYTRTNQEVEFYLGRLIKELNKQLQGDYDREAVSEVRTYAIGRLALVMRRWYPNTMIRRVRGLTTALNSKDQLEIGNEFFNRALVTTEEGYYTSFIRFMSSLYKEGKRVQFEEGRKGGLAFMYNLGKTGVATLLNVNTKEAATVKAKSLDYELEGIRKTRYDIYAVGLYTLLAMAIRKLGEEDEKGSKTQVAAYYLAYWVLKAQRELTSYYNPNEILRTVGSPSVLLNVAKEVTQLLMQILEDAGGQFVHPGTLEKYDRGRRKGTTKLRKEFFDVIPFGKQFNKEIDEQYSYLLNLKGW